MQQAIDHTVSSTPGAFGGTRSPASVLKSAGNRPAPVLSLADFPLFQGLDEATRARLDEACRWARYKAGQMILDPEDERRDVFFVAEGRVRVVNYASSGREVVHASLAAGDYFGELAVLGGQPRTAAVWAIEDTLIALVPPELLVEVVRTNGDIALRLLERLAHVVRDADERIAALS